MGNLAIKVENLGKQFQIGAKQASYSTLRETIMDTVSAPFRRVNSILRGNGYGASELNETIWALRDISFEVKHGEVLGIIGHNGAGKSTLLKILSRITEPSTGSIDIYGRVGALLEVGTGFHQELTGRENIYLNAAILGMRRAEIDRKFDEIVAFAEVERFIDTPVKHYSSGMGLRLGFAVAAHLEPEILIVDEVLAVGDAAFQKKCLGKMSEVAGEGRTVLFVSHNMSAILSLCQRIVVLNHGEKIYEGDVNSGIQQYLHPDESGISGVFNRESITDSLLLKATIRDKSGNGTNSFNYGDTILLELETNSNFDASFGVELRIKNSRQELIAYVSSFIDDSSQSTYKAGDKILVKIPHVKLLAGMYYIDVICRIPMAKHVDNWWDSLFFRVEQSMPGLSPIPLSSEQMLGDNVWDTSIVQLAQ